MSATIAEPVVKTTKRTSVDTEVAVPVPAVTKKTVVKTKVSKKAARRAWRKRVGSFWKLRFKKWWRAFRNTMRKARLKAVAAARRVKAMALKATERTVAAGRWLYTNTIASMRGAWSYTAPFRTWVSTPFRLAFGTTAGLATLLTFGSKVVVLLALPWIAFLLMSGRMTMEKQGKVKKLKKKIKKHDQKFQQVQQSRSTVEVLAPEDMQVLSEAQMAALLRRAEEVSERTDSVNETDNKNMRSEYAGRDYLLSKRIVGSTESVNQIAHLHRVTQEDALGEELARSLFTWSAVKRGIVEEDKVVKRLLAEAAAVEAARV